MFYFSAASAMEITGRFSLSGIHAGNKGQKIHAGQLGLRLMLEGNNEKLSYSLHQKSVFLKTRNLSRSDFHSSQLFRAWDGEDNYQNISSTLEESGQDFRNTRYSAQIDRALIEYKGEHSSWSIGRQPIDWGRGRIWQPLNVFGAFQPTDLDTDYKPGIDAVSLSWYSSALASLDALWVFSPLDDKELSNSAAVHYRKLLQNNVEISLLAGIVLENKVLGFAVESDWRGLGWRIEGVKYESSLADNPSIWIAGVDYQFPEGTLFTLELYRNHAGASDVVSLGELYQQKLANLRSLHALIPHLGRDVAAISLNRDINPLWNSSYTLLASTSRQKDRSRATSLLHQLNLTYSLGNESDLLFSILHTSGKKQDSLGIPQSEFGHLPTSYTMRYRLYF